MTDNIAIVTDQWKEMGGAEHVAMEMSRTFDAPIYAGIVDEEQVPDDIIVEEVFTGWERRCMDSHYLVRDFFQMFGWQHVEELYRYDTIILNKNNPGWFIPQDEQVVVKYCHSTPRQPYDLFHQEGRTYISRVVKTPMRIWYWPNLAYPDAWICNSELVQRRLNRYWNRSLDDVEVVYPPTDTSTYGPEYGEDREYYFTFSRLTEHKRIDEIIRAFNQHPEKRLVIGGDGEERAALEALAGENVEFVGYLSEEEKRRRLAECQGFVFAGENEDFGLTCVESLASGTPVIGVNDGFTRYQVRDGENGVLFERGTLARTLDRFEREGIHWDTDQIQQDAERYSATQFRARMRAIVERTCDAVTEQLTPHETKPDGVPTEKEPALADGGLTE